MRNLEGAYSLDGGSKRFIGASASSLAPQGFSCRAKGSKHLRPVESLASAMIAEAHGFFASAQRVSAINTATISSYS
jgi:hypothetical protein